MNDYMLVYVGGDHQWMTKTSDEEKAAIMQSWGAWMGKLKEAGQLVSGGSPLHYAGKAVTKEGVVTDLLASEVKELVTGYSLIKAEDEAAAVEIAKECPVLLYPGVRVEVRQIMSMGSD